MSYGGQSNPPWQRNTLGNSAQSNMSNMPNQMGMQNPMHFQNVSMYNQNMNMPQHPPSQNVPFSQLGGSMGQMQQSPQPLFSQAVSYPGPGNRGLNPIAFSTNSGNQQQSGNVPQQQNQSNNYNSIGTVTKVHNDCGFVDDEIFFHKNVCKGGIPKVGDRVLVESSFNQNSPFKLNATRIQILPSVNTASGGGGGGGGGGGSNNVPTIQRNQPPPLMAANVKGSVYNAVPPPNEYARGMNQRRASPRRSPDRASNRKDSRHREEDELDRKRRRDERERERDRDHHLDRRDHSSERRERSPIRRSSPKRRRTRVIPRYMVQIPKVSLTVTEADVLELRRRYTNLYIPSDFFFSQVRWSKSFKPDNPFSIQRPCSFHIMHKSVDLPEENNACIDPPDADYLYSAKVMLMGAPPIAEIYQKCLYDEKEREGERDFIHPTRLINFLVGIRGKNETMAIGGAWSPSLDGENPRSDPTVLIKTAMRTCKALTGIDLSGCTQWYRFVELYYHRGETTHKGRLIPARVETVVIFLPDINSCMPTRVEWDNVQHIYKANLERIKNQDNSDARNPSSAASSSLATKSHSASIDATGGPDLENRPSESPTSNNPDDHGHEKADFEVKKEPTHYSDLDPKTMKMQELRDELMARNLSPKGLKPQLVARLNKALNTEKAQNDTKSIEEGDTKVEEAENFQQLEENGQQIDEPAVEVELIPIAPDDHEANKQVDANDSKKEPPRKLDEKERQQLERRYQLPDTPHIIVHPSKVAKSGKFDCTVMSLSVLLDYRPEDTKERSFEVSLFAELFNEMLMRDFGFNIYKEIVMLPEKAKEKDGKIKEENKGADDNDEKSKDITEKKEASEREKSRERLMSDSDRSDKKSVKDPEKKAAKKGYDDDTEDDDYSVKSGDRRKKTKMIVAKQELLLSFVYFDTTHCGYIFEKDLEELFYIIGLNLSRAQVRKLLLKVISRDAIYYRKLTDKPKDDEQNTAIAVEVPQNGDAINVNVTKLAQGNRAFLPMVEKSLDNSENDTQLDQSDSNAGMVMYNGGLLDVEKLMEQMKRSEKAREDIEEILTDLRKQNSEFQSSNTKANNKIKDLQSETKILNRKLNDAEQNISSLNKKHNEYYNILSSIYDKVSPVFVKSERSSKSDSRDKEREKERERDRERDKDEPKESAKTEVKKE